MTELTITDVRVLPGDSAFLIDDGKTAILYDSGFACTGYRVAHRIKEILGDRTLNYIFLTHSHYDHALGSAYVRRYYPDVKVVAGAYATKIFRKPSARSVMRELDRKFAERCGIHEYEDLIDELQVDLEVNDGDVIDCGELRFTAIALPGHTRCSMGFYLADHRLLLGTETLGVYFGEDTYLPSCLVGYQMTLDSFRKARSLEIESILLPHYGVVNRAEAAVYLDRSEGVTIQTARTIQRLLRSGRSDEEILAFLTETTYRPNVRPTYPPDAFALNTRIMIALIRTECPEFHGDLSG